MLNSLYLAWRYILHNKIKTIIMVTSVTVIFYLPIGLNILVNETQEQLMARASSTPLIVGAKGSSLDLVINTLYFEPADFEELTMLAVDKIYETGFAVPIPMFIKFQARSFPIVGTAMEYFDFRGLEIEKGENLAVLGDCVIGSVVAKRLSLNPGDTLISSPENMFDIAGVYPLKMNIVGILKESNSPDDSAIFIDMKTAWVIEGLGHGHEDLAKSEDKSVLLGVEDGNYKANAKLFQYNTISSNNVNEFHFHGQESGFPVTAIIAVPHSEKDKALLLGRYISKGETSQIVKPDKVIKNLLASILKIKVFLDSIFFIVSISTILLLGLVVMLSLRLRSKEIQTMYRIGSSRFKIAELLVFEIGIIFIISLVCSTILITVTSRYVTEFIRIFIV
ncbi:MAG: ABC transporter permease [Candidatus Dadabacteria bacterium]|jgi:putative ABC transport system permease protein